MHLRDKISIGMVVIVVAIIIVIECSLYSFIYEYTK